MVSYNIELFLEGDEEDFERLLTQVGGVEESFSYGEIEKKGRKMIVSVSVKDGIDKEELARVFDDVSMDDYKSGSVIFKGKSKAEF